MIGQDLGALLASAAFPLDDAAKDLAKKDIQSWTGERRQQGVQYLEYIH